MDLFSFIQVRPFEIDPLQDPILRLNHFLLREFVTFVEDEQSRLWIEHFQVRLVCLTSHHRQ